MIRAAFVVSVLALVGGSAWAAGGLDAERQRTGNGVGLVLLVALQR